MGSEMCIRDRNGEKQLPVGSLTIKLKVRVEAGEEPLTQLYVEDALVGTLNVIPDAGGSFGFHTIGANRFCPVTEDYESPFIFQGEIEYVKIHTAASETSTKEKLDEFFAID